MTTPRPVDSDDALIAELAEDLRAAWEDTRGLSQATRPASPDFDRIARDAVAKVRRAPRASTTAQAALPTNAPNRVPSRAPVPGDIGRIR